MTSSNGNHHDRLIGDAAGRAADMFAGEAELGRLISLNDDGSRLYESWDGHILRFTSVHRDGTVHVVKECVGVDPAWLH